MTDKSKTPPAKKTIQDPPEYGAAAGPSEAVPSEAPHVISGGIGGEQATYQQNGQSYQQNGQSDRGRVPNDWESGPTGSGKSAAQGEGARNPQTGERIARNPQRSQPPEVDEQEGGGPDV
ncbi:hypothetical protein GFM11_10270 [Rhizobium leguminosarum bv. viciae]|uniref:hypothetical protein n=1 Tax=Rhizobium leguminosarum TaxID=384 RepID=UPI001441CCE6|nr:hypothetical protein [Rhizobium leguminosarum]NKK13663.1 hypothetical protein [Rhizobium leguminosarum bv. viciae]